MGFVKVYWYSQGKLKVAFSGLRQFLATKNPLKVIKYAFYFTLRVPFVFKIFKFSS